MLTALDDFIGHQTPQTFAYVATSDPAWMERLWYTGCPVPDGDMMLDIGLGYHPNLGIVDAHAGLTAAGIQHTVRSSRRLGRDPLSMAVGPIRFEVLEGMRRHRLTLARGEGQLSFELEWTATMAPHHEDHHFRRRRLRVVEDLARYGQAGRWSGVIELEGRRIVVDPGTWWGQRDHSWGVRTELATDPSGPALTHFPPFLFWFFIAQFEDCALHIYVNERGPNDPIYLDGEIVFPPGSHEGPALKVTSFEHDLAWADDPLGQTLASGVLQLGMSDGSVRRVELRFLPGRFYLKAGLYGGLRGWRQGDDKGALHVERESWTLTDPDTRRLARTLSDCAVEVRMGGKVGYGVCEYGVSRGYPAYPQVQHHPAP